ncbi:rhodanese-like domain-containing protein [Paraglaciecola sp. L3A3]|uniref:rhodanese-like domain-containing protein n=1 Tax=Paraglaciecola sp. L3A3 TaxID=2686358 RepID=UPI00131B9ECF|nr:rhodanese-like domain-containing protein [Paraglaciecola sp. L3A3]
MKSSEQYIAELRQEIEEVTVDDLQVALMQTEVVLIDVREHEEFTRGHIATAVNFPRGLLEMKLTEHPLVSHHCDPQLALDDLASRHIYLICRSGGRSALAARSLENMGHRQVFSVAGGMQAWQSQQYEIVHN